MTNIKKIGTAIALSLSTLATAATVSDCCAEGAACCEQGAPCCEEGAAKHRDHAEMAH